MYILGWGQFVSAGKISLQPSLHMPTAAMAPLVLPGVVKVVRALICAQGPPNLCMSFFFA